MGIGKYRNMTCKWHAPKKLKDCDCLEAGYWKGFEDRVTGFKVNDGVVEQQTGKIRKISSNTRKRVFVSRG